MFNDSREPLIEVAIQLLIVVLDYDMEQQQIIENVNNPDTSYEVSDVTVTRHDVTLIRHGLVLIFTQHKTNIT